MRLLIYIILSLSLLFQNACGPLKYKKVSAKDFPADPKERIKKNMEEGRGFRIMGGKNKGTSYEFASSNPLWKATLDVLDFMPLVSANYSGGIVITDWYSEKDNPNQSVKITVKFLTNEIRSDALDIDIFIKECAQNSFNCSINKKNNALVAELSLSILKKAASYEKQVLKEKNKNPYKFVKPKRKNTKKKKK